MSTCYICESLSNFTCNCSKIQTFMCRYHISDHLSHQNFKFFYTKSLKNNFENALELLRAEKQNIKTIEECLANSEKEFIISLQKVYLAIRLKIDRVQNDLDDAIKFLEDMKFGYLYDYLTIIKYSFEPCLFNNNSLVQFQDKTKFLYRKIDQNLSFKSFTQNLMKPQEFFAFDQEYFEFEINHAVLRETGIKLAQGLPQNEISSPLKLFRRNMNKRQFHYDTTNNNTNLLNYETSLVLSSYAPKVHRFYFENSELNDQITELVLNRLEKYKYIDFMSIKNSLKNPNQLKLFFSALKNKRVVKHIEVTKNLITVDYLNEFLSSFDFYKERIRSLNISKNFFSAGGCEILNRYLPSFTGLRDLNISYNDIKLEGVKMIQSGLSQLLSLEELNIKGNDLRAEGIGILMKSINFLPHLSVLNVSNNQGLDEGVLIIAGTLRYMKVLMILHIDYVISPETQAILCSSSYEYTKIIKSDGKEKQIIIQSPNFSLA